MRKIILGCLLWAGLLGSSGAWAAAATFHAQDYDLYAGDFNGDGKTDLLYVANSAGKTSGIALSDATGAPSVTGIPGQSWPSNYLGIQWSGNAYNVVVADFDGNGKVDSSDLRSIANALSLGYDIFGDLNGDGLFNSSDSQLVRPRIGSHL